MKRPEPYTKIGFSGSEEDFGWAVFRLEMEGDLAPLARFLLRGEPLSGAAAKALGHILNGELLGGEDIDLVAGGEGPFVVKAEKYKPSHRPLDPLKSFRAFDASMEVYRRVMAGETYTDVLKEVAKRARVTLNLLGDFVSLREDDMGPLPRKHPPTHTKRKHPPTDSELVDEDEFVNTKKSR